MRQLLTSLLWLILVIPSMAETKVEFNERILDAQNNLFQLKLKQGGLVLAAEESANPNNLSADYLRVIEKLLYVLSNESPESFVQFHKQAHSALKRIEASDLKSPWIDFFQEEIHFYTSVVHGKTGNALAAANEVRQSYKYGERCQKNYPEFTPALKTLGLIHAGFGNLPTTYRKLVSMLGYTGTTEKGISELNRFVQSTPKPEMVWMQREARLYLAAITLYLKNDPKSAWEQTTALTSDYQSNPLMVFVRANFAEKSKKNDILINTLLSCPKSPDYETIGYLNFALGVAKLQRLDADANVYLERYLSQYKGSNYVKSCYQKLAWYDLINGHSAGYQKRMQQLTSRGEKHLEEDQQAQLEADRGRVPDVRLLSARLLFDGGYYEKALVKLGDSKAEDYGTTLLKTEYCYRKARIYHLIGNHKLALAFYNACMLTGKDLSVYYASYAALFSAEIYEDQGNRSEASEFYRKSMSFKSNKEYRNSIEHRAKAGLHRVSSSK